MATELDAYLNTIVREAPKLLTGPSQEVGQRAFNIYEGSVIRPAPVNPLLAALTALSYSPEAGANSNIVKRSTSSGKIRPASPASMETVNNALLPTIESLTQQPILSKFIPTETASTPFTSDLVRPIADDRTARINEGAKLRGSNTKATLDERGQVVITGSSNAVSEVTPGSSAFSLAPYAAAIEKATTEEERFKYVQSMAAAVSAHQATKTGDALRMAEQQLGIPALEAKVKQEMLLDQQDSNFKGAWGGITLQAQAQLEAAKSNAKQAAHDFLQADPELAAIKTSANMLLQNSIKNIERGQAMADRMDAQSQEKAAHLATPVEAYLNTKPEFVANTKPQKFDTFLKLPKEEQEVAMSFDSPETVFALAVKRNPYAKEALVKKLSDGTVAGDVAARMDAEEALRLANDPKMAIELSATSVEDKAQKLKAYNTGLTAAEAVGGKDKASFIHEQGLFYANEAMQKQKFNEFNTVSKWDAPTFSKLITDDKTKKLYVSALAKANGNPANVKVNDLVNELTQLTYVEQLAARDKLIEYASEESDKRNKKSPMWRAPSPTDLKELVIKAQLAKILEPMGARGFRLLTPAEQEFARTQGGM